MGNRIHVLAGCLLLLAGCGSTPAGWHNFRDAALGYTISYPPGWRIDTHYTYSTLGPGREIRGVAIHIPAAMARGTNLSSFDTAISVETLPGPCNAARFLDAPQNARTVKENGITYLVAQGEDAGAGNLYQETIHAVADSQPCLAVRSFIHSTNIANYDPGTVRPFDRAALLSWFDRIRRTLVLRQRALPPAKQQ